MNLLRSFTKQGGIILYVCIGGIALLIELGSFYLLANPFDVTLAASNAVAMFAGMITSFSLNARYNFRVTDRLLARFASFAAITGLSYLCSTGLLLLLVEWGGVAAFVAKTITLPVVLAIQFTLNKRLTFASKAVTTTPAPAPQEIA